MAEDCKQCAHCSVLLEARGSPSLYLCDVVDDSAPEELADVLCKFFVQKQSAVDMPVLFKAEGGSE